MRTMTPTKKTVTEEEYHECSSDRCPECRKIFYIMSDRMYSSAHYECPHCQDLVKHVDIRGARREFDDLASDYKIALETIGGLERENIVLRKEIAHLRDRVE